MVKERDGRVVREREKGGKEEIGGVRGREKDEKERKESRERGEGGGGKGEWEGS